MTYKRVSIVDPLYFDVVSVRNLSKTLPEVLKLPKGNIPVFSAAKSPIHSISELINPPIFASETKPVLSFASNGDGSAGRNFIIHTQPFYIKAERIAFRPVRCDISLLFVLSQISDIKKKYKYSRTFLANRQNLKIVTIDFPKCTNGNLDIEAQKTIAVQFEIVEQLKKEIRQKSEQLKNLTIDIDLSDYSMEHKPIIYKTVKLTDENLFSLVSGGIGKNRTELQMIDTQNISDIPVYTAAQIPIAHIKPIKNITPIEASKEKPLLSFATNGDGSAGRNFILHTTPFYLNVDRIVVVLKAPELILPYLYTQILGIKKKYGFSHSFKANRHNLKNVTLSIPVLENGYFDVDTQKAIAEQFELAEQLRSEILAKLDVLLEQRIRY